MALCMQGETVLHPRDGGHCQEGDKEQHHSPKMAIAGKVTTRHLRADVVPSNTPRCKPRVMMWILAIVLGSCTPLQGRSGGYLIQNRKQKLHCVGCEHMFGLLSEGEKVKILINLSCWKNALQKRDSEWVTNHKIIIIKKPQCSGDIKRLQRVVIWLIFTLH